MTNVRPSNFAGMARGLSIVGRKLHGPACTAKSAGIVMALTVAGLVAGGTRIDTTEAVDVSYPGFFQRMAGLGARAEIG